MRFDLARVRARLFWWGGATGRVVLLRTIDRAELGVCEVWWSDPVHQDDAADAAPFLNAVQWGQLLAGAPVERLDLSLPLYRMSAEDDADDQVAVGHALTRPDFHPIWSMQALAGRHGNLVAADRPVGGHHRLARRFHVDLEATPDVFARLTTQAPEAAAEYDVALSDVRGVVIGDDNVQINRFDVTVENAGFDLGDVLSRPAVQRAIAEVTMDPGDEGRRATLVRALTHPGWSVSWQPARLSVTDPGAKRSGGFLASLLGINVDVMVGDGNRQRNHFTYVTSSIPQAQDLLAGNAELARAVVGLICPADGAADTASLLRVVNDEVRNLPVDFENDRLIALNEPPYAAMSLMHLDGGMVGVGNIQENVLDIGSSFREDDFEPFRLPEADYLAEERSEPPPDVVEEVETTPGQEWDPWTPHDHGDFPERGGPSLFY